MREMRLPTYYALCQLLNNYFTHVNLIALSRNKTQIKSNHFHGKESIKLRSQKVFKKYKNQTFHII